MLPRYDEIATMPFPQLDRHRLQIRPLSQRPNKVIIERDHVAPDAALRPLTPEARAAVDQTVVCVRRARRLGRPVILAFGAHAIKNGLAPILIELMESGWLTHLATNGAGIIHDWEFAWQGASSEDVRAHVDRGQFGIWEETGFYLNLALAVGAYEGLGYGESVGALVQNEGLEIPDLTTLEQAAHQALETDPERAGAAADLLGIIRRFSLASGWLSVPHRYKRFGIQAAAYRLGIPFTGHPMIGHDIIYTHPLNCGAAVGRTGLRDFLSFAHSVSNIEDGVYLSIGSAVMSPMIFEKSLSMAQNLALQEGRHIERHTMVVVDLAELHWDWQEQGEPPPDDPAYYLRYCKTFSRMGGTMRYVSIDNRDFLLALCQGLRAPAGKETS